MIKKVMLIIVVLLVLVIIGYGIYINYSDKENTNINVYDYYDEDETINHNIITEGRDIYLWDKDNIPTTTKYTENDGNYFDDPDFMPYMTRYDVPEGTKIKGAVLINPGGAFMFRSEGNEGTDVAEELTKLGYLSFVVHYRLRPYTMQEGALDLARAVRYVRANSEIYGIDEDDIAIIGFSAGGILCGEEILNFSGLIDATKLDSSYTPDELDKISADVKAVGFIYSFYGRLSVASTDVELFRKSNLPPAFYAYGTKDPFYEQMNASVKALEEANTSVEAHVLQNTGHGFGAGNNNNIWINDFDKWLSNIFGESENNDMTNNLAINANTTVEEVINNSAFKEFGEFIFPIQSRGDYSNMKISNINSLLPYHSHINTDTTIEVVNYMQNQVDAGNTIFYDIYSEEEKREDPSKEETGLFFFKGEPNAPFAIICAGGGFAYVGSIHESYPHALELSKKGYNAFAIQYRPDWDKSVEDLAKAISFIFENANTLQVNTNDYSLWGGSAGARMVAYIGTHGVKYFGGGDYPKPSTIIMQYTGHSEVGQDEVPTYAVVGENDGIANPSIMKRRIETLRSMGVDAEIKVYPNLSHGFGLGIGTSAEGWINDAVDFWSKHLRAR